MKRELSSRTKTSSGCCRWPSKVEVSRVRFRLHSPADMTVIPVRTPIEEKPEWRSFGGHITRHASVRTNCEWPELRCPTSWASLRKVCPPESLAAQSPLVDLPGSISTVTQNYTSRFTTPIGHFLSSPDLEQTTWCDQPDLQHLHAMHTYPLTWPYTIQLYPVFTCSKVPGYDDILFPAWWYWRNQTPYKDHKDPDWDNKRDEVRRGAGLTEW